MFFAIYWHESAMDLHVFPSPIPSPASLSMPSLWVFPVHQPWALASNLGWWSVSPLIVYLFQCYSLRISHPRLLPQSLKVCSVHLCLFFCFAHGVLYHQVLFHSEQSIVSWFPTQDQKKNKEKDIFPLSVILFLWENQYHSKRNL